jgi:hypothetical protein
VQPVDIGAGFWYSKGIEGENIGEKEMTDQRKTSVNHIAFIGEYEFFTSVKTVIFTALEIPMLLILTVIV